MYAVITGASSGIGEQFAKRLAKEGYDLILVARRRERLTALSDKLTATHKELECDIFTADLMQLDECQRLSDYLEEKDIEIFINNAGYGDCGLFEETDIAKEMGMIDVNVRAVHFLTKKLLRQMRVKDRGFILNVASSAGLIPAGPYMAAYYASKAYVASLSRAVACELRQSHSHVYVGCLCPGPVDTEFNDVANVRFALKGISAEYCANYAIDRMMKRKTVIVPTLRMKLATTCGRFLPLSLYIKIVSHQQKKKWHID